MSNKIFNAGKFISRGKGMHATRIIDSDELIYVLNGELHMFEGDNEFKINAGEWLFLKHGKKHGSISSYPHNLSFFWLHFLDNDNSIFSLPQHGKVIEKSNIADYLQNFLVEQNRVSPNAEILQLLFQLIICEIKRASNELPQVSPANTLAIRAHKLIMLEYPENITLHSISATLGCNSKYLTRLYKKIYNDTISNSINRLRIEKAAHLLTNSHLSIKEIAYQSGFNDLSYFRRKFSQFYSMLPHTFRIHHTIGANNSE